MRSIFNIMRNRLKLKFKKKSTVIVYMLTPIISVMVALVFNNMGQSNIRVGINDKDGSVISKELVQEIKSNKRFTVYELNELYLKENISDGKIDVGISIPEGFQNDVIKNNDINVGIFSQKDSSITIWIENQVNFYNVALKDIAFAAEGSEEVFFKIYDKFKNSNIKISNINLDDKSKNIGVSVQSIGLLLVFMFAGAGMTSSTILGDKMIRTYQRIRTSPLRKSEYILGNVLASLSINVIQILFILLISKTFVLKFYMSSWIVFIILFCFSTVAVGLGLFISSIAKSSSQSSQLSNLIIVPSSMLGGCFWPAYLMPEAMQKLAMVFPQWWVLRSFTDIQNGENFTHIIPYLGVILGFAVILFALALFNMRTKDDTKGFI